VPGHKGGAAAAPDLRRVVGERALSHDVPAYVEGIDIGRDPTPMRRALELAAAAWGAQRTWFLTGGASEGAHAACLAVARTGASAVVQRNVHVSTIHGLVLAGMRPEFVPAPLDDALGISHCLTREQLDEALSRCPAAVGAFVVSPTYFGVAGDVQGLAEVAHAHGTPLIVDEAWGAHFAFHETLPEDALSAGADLVLSGTHKTVGSLTQSAMLHLGSGTELIDAEAVNRGLALVQSTSPNALLLASLDAARRLAAVEGHDLLERVMHDVATLREDLRGVPGVDILDGRIVGTPGVAGFDEIRVVLDVRGVGIDGHALAARLARGADLHLELVTDELLVAHTGMAEDLARPGRELLEGLWQVVNEARALPRTRKRRFARPPAFGAPEVSPREAYLAERESVLLGDAVGRIAAESLSVYPPGTATVLPGERMTEVSVAYIERTLRHGGHLRGSADPTVQTTLVVRRDEQPDAPRDESLEVPSPSEFERFPARAYLSKYYSEVGSENATLLRSITTYLSESGAPTDTLVEVAGGPSLFSALAVAAVRRRPFERVLFTDLGQDNLEEVRMWVEEEPGRFDYRHALDWLARQTGAAEAEIAQALRSTPWELEAFDWRQPPPPEWQGAFDVVASHFFAESATADEPEFLAMLGRVPRLARQGSTLFMSFMSGSHGYTVDGREFPGFALDETNVMTYLDRAGVALTDVVLRTCAADEPGSAPGYEGLLFVAGRVS
jgi:lysine decarboxylase